MPRPREKREGEALTMACIEARGLRKTFGNTVALDGIDLRVEEGRILGLIGPNGAGKTTALNAILGLTPYRRRTERARPRSVDRARRTDARCLLSSPTSRCCRAGCASRRRSITSPACIRASIARRPKRFLARTEIKRSSKVRELSKGMVAQLHLALVMAIDAKLLVLDEPTLGLDILYRKQFYDSLLNDYFDHSRTIVVTTHQVEEIQHVLTDLMFINHGRIVLECSMEEFDSRYAEVMVHPDHARGRASAQAYARASGLRPQHHAFRRSRSRRN